MLNNLTPVQSFGLGFVSGALVGATATYFIASPSKEDKAKIAAFDAANPKK
jgi:hypothetical protein